MIAVDEAVGSPPGPAQRTDSLRCASGEPLGGRRFWTLAVLLSAGVALVRHWSMAGGWFSADDFVHMTRTTDQPLTDVLPLYNAAGHMNYLSGTLDWLVQRAAPYDWSARVWVVTVCVFLAQVLWMATGRLVNGSRASTLAVVTVVGLTTLAVTGLQWWAQAAASGPVLLLTAGAVLGIVVTVAGGSEIWAWLGVAVLGLGLAGSERMLLSAALLAVTPFLMGLRVGVREGLRTARRHWAPVLGVVLVATAYIAFYSARSTAGATAPTLSPEPYVRAFLEVLVPVLLGGPLGISEGAVTAVAATPQALVVGSALVVVLTLAVLARTAPRILIPIGMFALVWVLWSVAVLGMRTQLPGVALDWRIYADLTSWLMVGCLVGAAILRTARRPFRRGWRYAALGGLLVAAQLHAVTLVNATRYWWANPAEAFVDTALAELRARPSASLLDEPLPMSVIRGSLITEERRPSVVFGGLPDPLSIDQPTPYPLLLDESGYPHLARVEGGTSSAPGSEEGCGWLVDGARLIPMRGRLYPWNWLMRIGYLSGADGEAVISSAGRTVTVPITKGLGEVYLPWRAELGSIVSVGVPQGVGFCVDSIDVGQVGRGDRAPQEEPTRP